MLTRPTAPLYLVRWLAAQLKLVLTASVTILLRGSITTFLLSSTFPTFYSTTTPSKNDRNGVAHSGSSHIYTGKSRGKIGTVAREFGVPRGRLRYRREGGYMLC